MQAIAKDNPQHGIHPTGHRLPASARIGRARLAVSNLEHSIHFYSGVIGLAVLHRTADFAQLGPHNSDVILIELEALPGILPIHRRPRLGLYHTAVLLPSRLDLASFADHLNSIGVPFGGGDHLVSEALYLTDPDGLTVEVYADRPREQWTYDGPQLISGTFPVRFNELAALNAPRWLGAPARTTLGHVHLYVGDLEAARAFYHSALGFDIVTWSFPGALFISAGGYHHHVGLNTWIAGSPIASRQDARLLLWELVFPDAASLELASASLITAGYEAVNLPSGAFAFRDLWGITVALVSDS